MSDARLALLRKEVPARGTAFDHILVLVLGGGEPKPLVGVLSVRRVELPDLGFNGIA